MWKYVLKRIGLIVLTAFIILSISYILIQTLPVAPPEGGAAVRIAFYDQQVDLGYYMKVTLAEVIEKYPDAVPVVDANGATTYYQAVPVLDRYIHWLGNIFTQWNWGVSTSISSNENHLPFVFSCLIHLFYDAFIHSETNAFRVLSYCKTFVVYRIEFGSTAEAVVYTESIVSVYVVRDPADTLRNDILFCAISIVRSAIR